MVVHASSVQPGVVWDSNTTEEVITVEGTAGGTITVPANCHYIIITVLAESSGGAYLYISPDAATNPSGVALDLTEAGSGRRFETPVKPGTVITLHTAVTTEMTVGVVYHYLK